MFDNLTDEQLNKKQGMYRNLRSFALINGGAFLTDAVNTMVLKDFGKAIVLGGISVVSLFASVVLDDKRDDVLREQELRRARIK